MIAVRNIDKGNWLAFCRKIRQFLEPQLANAHCGTVEQYAEKLATQATIAYHEVDGEIVGMVAGYTGDPSYDTSYITQVYVLKSFRGGRMSRVLLAEYADYCRSIGLRGIWLTTQHDNIAARKAYGRFGFKIDESFHDERLVKMVYELCIVSNHFYNHLNKA